MQKFKDHKITTIDELHVFSRTGVVSGCSTWSETRVYGGGGANNTNVSISSSVREKQRYFIVDKDGDETEINDSGLSVRDGQVVTAVYCGRKNDSNYGFQMGYHNHNTGNSSYVTSSIESLTGKPKKSMLYWGIFLALFSLVSTAMFIVFFPITAGLAALLIYLWVTRTSRSKVLIAQVRTAIDRQIEESRDIAKTLKARQSAEPAAMSEAAGA